MKLTIQKKLENGKYYVNISTTDFDQIELENMKKFGSPMISILPIRIRRNGIMREELPIYDLSYDYPFDDIDLATKFVTEMTKRIKQAAEKLKYSKDDFSGTEEINL